MGKLELGKKIEGNVNRLVHCLSRIFLPVEVCGARLFCISKYILIACFIFSSFALAASEYRFSSLTMESGLSNNSVFTIAQDYLGYMWMGTFGGLTRFDGNEYVAYKPDPSNTGSLTSSVVFDILEDSRKRVWIGTDGGGLNLYHRDSDTFSSSRFDPDNPDSLSSDQVFSLCEDSSGALWIGTGGGGLNRMIDTEHFVTYMADPGDMHALQSNTIRKIIQDHSGTIWIGTDGGGLARYLPEEDSFTTYWYKNFYRWDGRNSQKGFISAGLSGSTIESETLGTSIKALYEDSREVLWVGFEGVGLTILNPATREFYPLELEELTGINSYISIRSVIEDSFGRIWVGTDGDGLYILQLKEQEDPNLPQSYIVNHIKSNPYLAHSLSSDKIRDIFIDMTGLIWIGLRDGGINLFNPLSLSFKNISQESPENNQLSGNKIREITESADSAIWIATDGNGLNRLDPVSGIITQPLDRLPVTSEVSGLTYSLLADGDLLWIGTDGAGVYAFDMKNNIIKKHFTTLDDSQLSSNVIWDIYQDDHGILWLGTEGGGLNRYDSETGTFTPFRFDTNNPSSIRGNSVRVIFQDSLQNLWVGTWDGGLNRYISDSAGFERFVSVPGDSSSLSDNSVNTIFEDSNGVLWIGTAGGGVNAFNTIDRSFTSYKQIDGLTSDNVLGILEDAEGFLWFTTDNGLTRFNTETKQCIKFIAEDGIQGNEFTQKAFFSASNGIFYVGGTEGVTFFDPQHIIPRSVDSPFLITGLKLQNKNVTVGPLQLEDSKELRALLDKPLYENPVIQLDPRDRFITFSFALFDFVNPDRNEYSVALDGLDTGWTDLGNKNSITFATLPPGTYTLRIRGIHYNGLLHPQEQSITIHVDKYLWQQWYFILALCLVSGLLLFGVYILRMRALHAKNAELRRYSLYIQEAREQQGKIIAREIHDELGQMLTSLKFDTFWVVKKLKQYIAGQDADPTISDSQEMSAVLMPDCQMLLSRTGDMIEVIDSALESVKTISTRLRPSALDSLCFSEALQWQALEFQKRTGIICKLESKKESKRLPEEVSITLFRVLQEVLTNIMRHAQATAVTITFHETDTDYYLKISDNGIGCTQKQLRAKTSFGIISIRERCEAVGGTVRISSSRLLEVSPKIGLISMGNSSQHSNELPYGKGTTIEILIPLGKE